MSDTTSRKYIKTKFEGVFYRLSKKRDPRTGELDRIYAFWYSDAENKGHWKTVGRHSEGVRPTTARRERAKFLLQIADTGLSPAEREKVTVGMAVESYTAWGKSEGKFIKKPFEQYNYHLRSKLHAMPIGEVTPDFLSGLKAHLLNKPVRFSKKYMLAAQTVNHIFCFLRAAVNRAIATGLWNGNNPFSTKDGLWKMAQVNKVSGRKG